MTMIDLDSVIPDTDITVGEVLALGHQTLGAASAMLTLGHVNISGLTDYVVFPTDRMSRVLEGMVRSALFDPSHKSEAMTDMKAILWDSGWMHHIAELAADYPGAELDRIAEAMV